MDNPFFDHPILKPPYDYPPRHWELDEAGQRTPKIIEARRSARRVTPETSRLLQHRWRPEFADVRSFFCEAEAVETAIWLTEVALPAENGKRVLDRLAAANKDANPELIRPRSNSATLETSGEHIDTDR